MNLARAAAVLSLVAWSLAACSPTTPAPLPAGATSLGLATRPAPAVGLDVGGCASALVEPVVIAREDEKMVFIAKDTAEQRPLTWPAGFSARLFNGVAELVTPLGNVYGREGDVLSTLGASRANDGSIAVCFASSDEYRNGP